MKPQHLINAIIFGIGSLLVGWFVVFYGAWFVPRPWLRFTALLIALPIAAYFSFRIIPRDHSKLGAFALPNTMIVKIGGTTFYAAVLWMLLAQSIPAALTNLFGDIQTTQETVDAFYHSTSTCGYRLVLSRANPPFGGYCRAGSRGAFAKGTRVIVTYKSSILGMSILHIRAAAG